MKSASFQLPSPAALSDVMFGPKKVPKGVFSARPPAKGTAPSLSSVWQPTQPPALARYSPCFASPCARVLPASKERSTSQRRMVADYALEKESPAVAGLSLTLT